MVDTSGPGAYAFILSSVLVITLLSGAYIGLITGLIAATAATGLLVWFISTIARWGLFKSPAVDEKGKPIIVTVKVRKLDPAGVESIVEVKQRLYAFSLKTTILQLNEVITTILLIGTFFGDVTPKSSLGVTWYPIATSFAVVCVLIGGLQSQELTQAFEEFSRKHLTFRDIQQHFLAEPKPSKQEGQKENDNSLSIG